MTEPTYSRCINSRQFGSRAHGVAPFLLKPPSLTPPLLALCLVHGTTLLLLFILIVDEVVHIVHVLVPLIIATRSSLVIPDIVDILNLGQFQIVIVYVLFFRLDDSPPPGR